MKKILALLLALTVLLSFAACKGGEGKPGADDDTPAAAGVSADTAVGDKVSLGKLDGKPLAWTAIAKGVGTVLLLSDNVLARMPFAPEEKNNARWKDSDARAWLNGEFYDSTFSDDEKALIAETNNRTDVFNFDEFRTESEYTDDKVFLLSGIEFAKYVVTAGDLRFGIPTKKLIDDGVYMAEVEGSETVKQACGWILRDDGEQETYTTMEVYGFDGTVSLYGNQKTNVSGIRPAMWVYTDKALADGWKAGTATLPADPALDAAIAALHVGDTVEIGMGVMRDLNLGGQKVVWRVLDETDDAFLLYSEKLLGAGRFGPAEDTTVTWATSEARAFLNGDEYLNGMFTPWERAKIKRSHVVTCGATNGWQVDPGPETDDDLFLLDREEMEKYFPNEADRVLSEQTYWLRSPDFTPGNFTYVNEAGGFSINDAPHYAGLRVAMWILK